MRILRVGYRPPPDPGGKERPVERRTQEQLLQGQRVVNDFIGRPAAVQVGERCGTSMTAGTPCPAGAVS